MNKPNGQTMAHQNPVSGTYLLAGQLISTHGRSILGFIRLYPMLAAFQRVQGQRCVRTLSAAVATKVANSRKSTLCWKKIVENSMNKASNPA